MIDAYNTYQEVIGLCNKEENGYLPADLFNRFSWIAQRFVFNDYQTRLQNPQTAAAEKQKLLDRLTPFIVRKDIAVENGFAFIPSDYAYFSAAKAYYDNGDSITVLNALYAKLCQAEEDPGIDAQEVQAQIDAIITNEKLKEVQLLDNEQVGRRLTSYVPGKRPSIKKPIMERTKDPSGKSAFKIYPASEPSLFLWYYTTPQPSILVMREVPATGDLTYDKDNSTGFEWHDEAMQDIIAKIVENFGAYIRERDLIQISALQKS